MKIDLKKEISLPKLSLPKRSSGGGGRSSLTSRFSLPKLSLPGRSRPLNGPGGPSVKMPKFVSDLYGDLRDRPVLGLLVVGLVIAIIAAPIVLSGGGGSDEPTEVAPIEAGGETATSAFSVVPAESTLRSPNKVDHRAALNPFRGVPSSGTSNDSGSEGATPPAESGGGTPTAESSGVSTTPEAAEATPIETLPTESGSGAETSTPAHATEETSTTTESESTEVTTSQNPDYAVSMKTGFTTEKLTEQAEVQPMTKLPGKKDPALLYIGLSQDQKTALFLMTSKVTAYYGAAHCTLDKAACELVELKPGKSATFEFGLGEEATRYKVVLGKIQKAAADEESAKKTVTKTRSKTPGEGPSERGNSLAQARSFSK